MKAIPRYSFALAALTIALGAQVHAQVSQQTLNTLSTPSRVETRIGPLDFKDGAPSAETVQKVRDTLDFTRGLDAFLNSYGAPPPMRSGRISQHRSKRQLRRHLSATAGFELTVSDWQYGHGLLHCCRGSDEGSHGGGTTAEGRRHHQRHVVSVDH
jgi:hypothetical protein